VHQLVAYTTKQVRKECLQHHGSNVGTDVEYTASDFVQICVGYCGRHCVGCRSIGNIWVETNPVSVGAVVFSKLSGLRTTAKHGQLMLNRPCCMTWCAVLLEPCCGSFLFSYLSEEFMDYIVVTLRVKGVLGANNPKARAAP
jgi:hypothetical protein